MQDVLLVVDMLNDFVHELGVLNFVHARKIVPFIKSRLIYYRMNRYKLRGLSTFNVIYLCDCHSENDEEFKRFPKHAIANTWGSKVVDDLMPLPEEKVVYKTRFNGFYNTVLEPMLEELMPRVGNERQGRVEVVGLCTSICVMDTVGGLVERDFKVVVPMMGVADFHDESHRFAINRMEKIYGADIKKGR